MPPSTHGPVILISLKCLYVRITHLMFLFCFFFKQINPKETSYFQTLILEITGVWMHICQMFTGERRSLDCCHAMWRTDGESLSRESSEEFELAQQRMHGLFWIRPQSQAGGDVLRLFDPELVGHTGLCQSL